MQKSKERSGIVNSDKKIPIFKTLKEEIDKEELHRLILAHQQYQNKYKLK